jgi:type IV secretion system protein VirD4
MIERAAYDLLRLGLRIAVRLWPLWLFWFAWTFANDRWLSYLLTFPDRTTPGYALAYHAWPTVALLGPILLMLLAILAYRMQLTSRTMPVAGIAGVLAATTLTAWPEYQRLAPCIGSAPLLDVLRAPDPGILQAVVAGLVAAMIGCVLTVQRTIGPGFGPRLIRGRSDNFGHADWLAVRDARRLFPGPDDTYGASSSAKPTASTRIAWHAGRSTRLTGRVGDRAAPRRYSSIPAAPAPPTPSSSPGRAASRPPPSASPLC